MFKSKLFLKAFSGMTVIIAVFSLTTSLYLLPAMDRHFFEAEERSAKTILDNVYFMAKRSWLFLENYRESAIDARKREIQNILQLAESYITNLQAEVKSGRTTEDEAKARALKELRSFKYGHNDYIAVSDYRSVLISHPDPKLNGADFSRVKDIKGTLIVTPMVEKAVQFGEGYHTYWWKRLGEKTPVEKLSYCKRIPEWKWVLITGVYIDDIEKEMQTKKEGIIEELRQTLRGIRIAKTGYIYIFDKKMNMIIHPNQNIEGKSVPSMIDPTDKKPFFNKLIGVADNDQPLHYKWDKPDDPGNYIYDKISWVRYFEGFDWYIGSSVYEEELSKNSTVFLKKIISVTLAALLIAAALVYLYVKHLLGPIARLSHVAVRVREGDLTVQSGIKSDDEIGVLSKTFDGMIEQLRTNIETLDNKVKERTSELEIAVEKLKTLDELKSSFLSNVSHELRTPLTSVRGFAMIIKKRIEGVIAPRIQSLDEKTDKALAQVRENIDIIISESERLTDLINDVLDLAKMEEGRMEWKKEPIDMAELVDHAASALGPLFSSKGITFVKQMSKGLVVIGDPDRLMQVMVNLISNALKFTDKGSITVKGRQEKDFVEINVIDTGIGIMPEDLDKIFEKFKQVGNTLTDKPHGTGLGLPICKQIIENYRGEIRVESRPGKGSSFFFTLPSMDFNINNQSLKNQIIE